MCRADLHANQQSQLHDQNDTEWVTICYVRHNLHDKDAWHETDLHRICYQPHASIVISFHQLWWSCAINATHHVTDSLIIQLYVRHVSLSCCNVQLDGNSANTCWKAPRLLFDRVVQACVKTLHGPYLDDGGQCVLHNGLTAQQLHAQCLLELNGAHLLHARLHQALSKGLRLSFPATL